MPRIPTSRNTVAVVGLGAMGLPIAGHVASGGSRVLGWDADSAACEAARAAGVQIADDLDSALRAADVCLVLVGSERAVDAVVRGALAVMRRGTVQVILGTIGTSLAESLVEAGLSSGHRVLNAPLCRATRGAADADCLALVSGEEDSLASCRDVLETFCSDIEYLGPRPAHAQVAKAINNLMLWASVIANEESFRLADAYGLDTERVRRALITSTGDSWSLREWEHVDEWTWSKKDLRVFAAMADLVDAPAPLAAQLAPLVARSTHLSHANENYEKEDDI